MYSTDLTINLPVKIKANDLRVQSNKVFIVALINIKTDRNY